MYLTDHFSAVCASPFWNAQSLYENQPDLTFCLQYTLLAWFPCVVFWLIAPVRVYMLTKLITSAQPQLRFSPLSLAKTATTVALVLSDLLVMYFSLAPNITYSAVIAARPVVYFITPFVQLTTNLLSLVMSHFERKCRYASSVHQFTYWTISLFMSIIYMRSTLLQLLTERKTRIYANDTFAFLAPLFMFKFVCTGVNCVLCCFPERVSEKSKQQTTENIDLEDATLLPDFPYKSSSVISYLTFDWIRPLIWSGSKRELRRDDMWRVDDSEASSSVTRKLQHEWEKLSSAYMKVQRENELQSEVIRKLPEPSLALAICRAVYTKFLGGSLLKLINDVLNFMSPLILDRLIDFFKDREQKSSVGLVLAGALFLTTMVRSLVLAHYFNRMTFVGARIRTGLMNLIYEKSLRLSSQSRKAASVGEMTNLISVNTDMFIDLINYMNNLWSAPLQITVCTILLWKYLGIASIVGVASMVFFLPLNAFISVKSRRLRVLKLRFQDQRIKMINELLSGIKVIKFYGWEDSFSRLIGRIRTSEMAYLLRAAIYSTVSSFTWDCSPFLVAAISFSCFVLIDEANILDAKTAFVSLALFDLMRFPISVLPGCISNLINTSVALERIRSFLLREEMQTDLIGTTLSDANLSISIRDVDIGWSKDEPLLRNIRLDVKKGSLVAVVGRVGSGKSSLLSALLGEMHQIGQAKAESTLSRINLCGRVAYVPQQAWIQNATVRGNILFGSAYRGDAYMQALRACCLTSDLRAMPAGDLTEIGEKGINLSGGQRQRVSVARALYAEADVYLLDDPLSAVDAHVARSMFDAVIGPRGLLNGRTRIFVTNALGFLRQCDQIVLMDQGRIVQQGTYEQLISDANSAFARFVNSAAVAASVEMTSALDVSNSRRNSTATVANSVSPSNTLQQIQTSTHLSRSSSTSSAVRLSVRRSSSRLSESAVAEPLVVPTSYVDRAIGVASASESGDNQLIEKEKVATGRVKLQIILDYFRSCHLLIFGTYLLLSGLVYTSMMLSNLWLGKWSNAADQQKPGADHHNERSYYLLVYIAFGCIQCVFSLLSEGAHTVMCIRAVRNLHNSMLESILRSTLRFFESTPSGRIINRFSKDMEATESSIPNTLKDLVSCLFYVLSIIVLTSATTPWFMLPLAPLVFIYVTIQRYYVASTRQLKRMYSVSRSPIFSHFGETLSGVSCIRAYQAEQRFVNTMRALVDENLIYFFPNTVSTRWLAIVLEMLGNFIVLSAAVFAVMSRDSLSTGMASMIVSINLNVSSTLNWVVKVTSEFEAEITSVERIKEYSNTPKEGEWNVEAAKPGTEWPERGEVEFVDYNVKYRIDLPNALEGLNVRVSGGEKIGIVGRTGAGKSSLTLGLFRLLEHTSGSIIIDGVDISKIGLHQLRQKLTIIPQEPFIFSGSIRQNLDPFGTFSDEKLWTALERANLKEFVSGLEGQLAHECTEAGDNLSVGQRQLICLARALLRHTRILVLDEATASVDNYTDELIQRSIRAHFGDCTVFTIAHRLNTIMDSTRVVVLDQGHLAEFNTPGNLLANTNSIFYSMCREAKLV